MNKIFRDQNRFQSSKVWYSTRTTFFYFAFSWKIYLIHAKIVTVNCSWIKKAHFFLNLCKMSQLLSDRVINSNSREARGFEMWITKKLKLINSFRQRGISPTTIQLNYIALLSKQTVSPTFQVILLYEINSKHQFFFSCYNLIFKLCW